MTNRPLLGIVFASTLLRAGAPAAAIDLTGKWRMEHSATYVEFIDVVQTGSTVATTLSPSPGFPIAFTGTFDEPNLLLSLSVPGCTPPSCYGGVTARVLQDGDWFDGYLVFGSPPLPGTGRTLASRCECFDGNATAGDGCDASCRVEPCFTCAGMPSVCVPTLDGGACEDGAPCTGGETCSAGTCGGGSTVSPCIDLRGLFDVHTTSSVGDFDAVTRVEQYGDALLFRDAASGSAGGLGTIDFSDGDLSVVTPVTYILCTGFNTATGTATANGASYALSGTSSVPTPHGCFGVTYTSAAARRTCGDGITTGDEQCDDGNIASGDGCDGNCTVTGCGNGIVTAGEQCDDGDTTPGDGCSATCALEQCGDGTPNGAEQCDDGNLVSGDGCDANCRTTGCGSGIRTAGEECDDGNTGAGDGCGPACAIEPCWVCPGVQPSSCATAFQPLCAPPLDARRAKLKLRQRSPDRQDLLNARSGDTSALPLASLGDPLLSTDYDVCLYDRSQPAVRLVFGARVPAGGTCDGRPCWRSVAGGFSYRNADGAPHGITTLRVIADRAGAGQLLALGKRELLSAAATGFPALPMPVPLELQVVNADDGAGCIAVEIPAAGVVRNDPVSGRFQGSGAP